MDFANQVVVVNRVRDKEGNPVPYDAWIGGQVLVIKESVSLPPGIARIVVHNSMYKMDGVSYMGKYKLGVAEWGMEIGPVSVTEVHPLELIERETLTPDRQFGFVNKDGKQLKSVVINNPIRRHDPIASNIPSPREDGAHPAGFGENQ